VATRKLLTWTELYVSAFISRGQHRSASMPRQLKKSPIVSLEAVCVREWPMYCQHRLSSYQHCSSRVMRRSGQFRMSRIILDPDLDFRTPKYHTGIYGHSVLNFTHNNSIGGRGAVGRLATYTSGGFPLIPIRSNGSEIDLSDPDSTQCGVPCEQGVKRLQARLQTLNLIPQTMSQVD
jgi:hypothetical protein